MRKRTGRFLEPCAVALVIAAGIVAGCQSTTIPAETLRERGNRYYDRQEYGSAATQYAAITNRYPGDWQAQYRLGLCQLELDNLNEAYQALEIAMERRPGDPDVADALAEALYRSGDTERLFAFLESRTAYEQTPGASIRLGRYAQLIGDPDTARRAYETAIALGEGRSVEPYLEAAAFYQSIGQLDLAVIKLRQAYAVDPRDQRVVSELRSLGEIPGPTLALPPID